MQVFSLDRTRGSKSFRAWNGLKGLRGEFVRDFLKGERGGLSPIFLEVSIFSEQGNIPLRDVYSFEAYLYRMGEKQTKKKKHFQSCVNIMNILLHVPILKIFLKNININKLAYFSNTFLRRVIRSANRTHYMVSISTTP